MPAIGLVTVLYNSNDVLKGFFKSLGSQVNVDYHLYFIDNQNSADTEELVAALNRQYPILGYTYIKNTYNAGVATANNQGIKASLNAGTQYTLLLNNDIEFDQPNFLEQMYKKAVDDQEALIIPKILYYDSRKIWMAGGSILEYKGIVSHIGMDHDDGPEYSKPAYFDYAPTCFMLMDNKIFDDIGTMNEDYFVYYDDTDFLYRAKKAGYRILYMPELIVLHKVSSSTGGSESTFSLFYNHRNRLYFISQYDNLAKKTIAFGYTFFSRLIRYLNYNKSQREAVNKGLKDGMLLSFKKKS
jgi:GT2 family glycosyltransferase